MVKSPYLPWLLCYIYSLFFINEPIAQRKVVGDKGKSKETEHFHSPQMKGVSSELSAQSFTKSHSSSLAMQCLLAHVNS